MSVTGGSSLVEESRSLEETLKSPDKQRRFVRQHKNVVRNDAAVDVFGVSSVSDLIIGFCILLRMYPLMLFLKTTIHTDVFCDRFYCALLTACFGPDQWPSSGNMYIKYIYA
jgi:hypothetical protein